MDKQIIVFAGPDRCGKTEISYALSHVLNIGRFKAKSEHDSFLNKQDMFINQLRFADTRMVDFLSQTGYSVIFDRAWCCEWVYSQYFKRETDLKVLEHVDEEMANLGAKIIICTRTSFDGIQDDLNPKLNCEALTKIQGLYKDFAEWTKCDVYFLNVDDENLVREISEILTFLKYTSDQKEIMLDDLREYEARLRAGASVCCF